MEEGNKIGKENKQRKMKKIRQGDNKWREKVNRIGEKGMSYGNKVSLIRELVWKEGNKLGIKYQ